MEPERIQRLVEETAREIRRLEREGVWSRGGEFPSVAEEVLDWGEKSHRIFMVNLARECWPNGYLAHVLWRYITPHKTSTDKVPRIRPIKSAPSISKEYAARILKANSGLESDEELWLQGESGFHTISDLKLKCDEIMYRRDEFIGAMPVFTRIYPKLEFRHSDWNLNEAEGMPRLRRTVTNLVRHAVGRPALHTGKGKMDNALDESWKEMLAFDMIGGKAHYRYIGKGKHREPDPVEAALVAEVGKDDDGSGHVYAIVNDAWPGWVKIGMSVDWERRLDSYQTSSPHRDYRVLGATEKISDRHRAEARAHVIAEETAAERSGEWFQITNGEAEEVLKRTEAENQS